MNTLKNVISKTVQESLREDIGSGDITASLIPTHTQATAQLITREPAIIAGQAWVNEVFHQIDPSITVYWLIAEGQKAIAGQPIAKLRGSAQHLLTGERTALNWLQTLSGTATQTAAFVEQLRGTKVKLLDTRKTLPGLRAAQKYAVTCGGGHNHRIGLFDAFLIKENHIRSTGSIHLAIEQARANYPGKLVEIEVETQAELEQALAADSDIIMLDNFTLEGMKQAVATNQNRAKLEVSGNVSIDTIKAIASTGIDYISVGALTKHVQAVDLSMRIIETS